MACFSSLTPPGRRSRMTAFQRSFVFLAAVILVTMPMVAPAKAAATTAASVHHPKISTEDAIRLLSSPGSVSGSAPAPGAPRGLPPAYRDIDFHGVPYPLLGVGDFTSNVTDEIRIGHASATTTTTTIPPQKSHPRMNTAIYPTKDRIPDVNSPQVRAWVAEIDWSKVPDIPVAEGLPDVPHFPKCPPDDQLNRSACWWTCAGCVSGSDIITCPDKNSWGLTYDDGPSLATRDMMKYLTEKQLTATFFIVGSRVLEYPDILKEQVAQGHHIAMHTWSHAGLTTLTNHQIVAEIRWSEKIIRDVTGLTMKYVRPPYGDTDNRVREILRQMGYTTVIWSAGWDTNDWRMLQNQVQEWEIVQNFDTHLAARDNIKSALGQPAGPVTLEHDLTNATIGLSKKLIPKAIEKGLKPMSLAQCLSDVTPYQRGSRLGPNGAVEKITNGEGKGSFRGMPGMEEQDFKPAPTSKVVAKTSAGTETKRAADAILWVLGFVAATLL